jgi:hypothetical protein
MPNINLVISNEQYLALREAVLTPSDQRAIEKEAAGLHFTKDELGWIKSYMTHAYKTTDSFEGDHDGTNCFNISVKAGLMAANFDVDDWEGEE